MIKNKMRTNKLLLILGLFLILSGTVFAQERTWKTFSPDNREWTILAPGLMKPDSEALQSPSTKGSYSYSDTTGFFVVAYRDAPKLRLTFQKPFINSYFRKIRNDAVKSAKGQLLSDEKFTNGEVSGREVYIKMSTGRETSRESGIKLMNRVERIRMFFRDNRLYVLLAVMPEDKINTSEVNNFLNSFVAK